MAALFLLFDNMEMKVVFICIQVTAARTVYIFGKIVQRFWNLNRFFIHLVAKENR